MMQPTPCLKMNKMMINGQITSTYKDVNPLKDFWPKPYSTLPEISKLLSECRLRRPSSRDLISMITKILRNVSGGMSSVLCL